jgi:hypothetical protein
VHAYLDRQQIQSIGAVEAAVVQMHYAGPWEQTMIAGEEEQSSRLRSAVGELVAS